jgi:hypothetical protein
MNGPNSSAKLASGASTRTVRACMPCCSSCWRSICPFMAAHSGLQADADQRYEFESGAEFHRLRR